MNLLHIKKSVNKKLKKYKIVLYRHLILLYKFMVHCTLCLTNT